MATTINIGVTQRGLNGAFFPAFAEAPTLWRELAALINSDGSKEDYKWLGQLPMPVEWRGERRTQALRDFGQTIVNRHWESTLQVDRDDFEDDQTGQLALRAAELGRRFALHPDKLVVDLIEAGEASLAYDGQFFFDTDHVEGDSGSQSNNLSYDAVAPTAPTAAEFKAAFWQAIKALAGFKDDAGEPWNWFTEFEQLAGIVAFVPPAFLDVASDVLGANAAPLLNNTSNILAGRGKVKTSPRLSWTTKFAIFKVDDPMRPFIFQNRKNVKTDMIDDPLKKDVVYAADGRYAVGYGLWQKAVLTTFV
jgi:phage major head subunit gpT-like protein